VKLYEIKSPHAAWWVSASTAFSALAHLKKALDTDTTVQVPEEFRPPVRRGVGADRKDDKPS